MIWEGGIRQFEENLFFKKLSGFCQELLKTMQKHLEGMIINNGLVECNELLMAYFKLDFTRVDGHLYKNAFDFQMWDTYPYTLNGILADL